jgi:hypothetical protein
MMAMIPPLSPLDVYPHMIDDSKLHAIQGTPVIVNYMVDEFSAMQGTVPTDDEIKERLCNELAYQMYKLKLIEFTREKTVYGSLHYRARIFAVPQTSVQYLRERGIIK